MTDTQQPTRVELIEDALRKRNSLAAKITYYSSKYNSRYSLDDIIDSAMMVRMAQAEAQGWRWVMVPKEEEDATRT